MALLSLPLELRTMIYELHFEAMTVNVKPDVMTPKITNKPPLPALAKTCKQIRNECKKPYHSKALFRFPSTVVFIDILFQWSRTHLLQQVRKIEIRMTTLFSVSELRIGTRSRIATMLKVFPELNLDNLILYDCAECYSGSVLPRLMALYSTRESARTEVTALLELPSWKRLELNYCCGGRVARSRRAFRDLKRLRSGTGTQANNFSYDGSGTITV